MATVVAEMIVGAVIGVWEDSIGVPRDRFGQIK